MSDWNCASCMAGLEMSQKYCPHCDNGPRREASLRSRIAELEGERICVSCHAMCEGLSAYSWNVVKKDIDAARHTETATDGGES